MSIWYFLDKSKTIYLNVDSTQQTLPGPTLELLKTWEIGGYSMMLTQRDASTET